MGRFSGLDSARRSSREFTELLKQEKKQEKRIVFTEFSIMEAPTTPRNDTNGQGTAAGASPPAVAPNSPGGEGA